MSAHTPGPWQAQRQTVNGPFGVGVAWCGDYRVHSASGSYVIRTPEAEANARLIAAAPELLAACGALVLQVEYLHAKFGETGSGMGELARARDAIRKATGI